MENWATLFEFWLLWLLLGPFILWRLFYLLLFIFFLAPRSFCEREVPKKFRRRVWSGFIIHTVILLFYTTVLIINLPNLLIDRLICSLPPAMVLFLILLNLILMFNLRKTLSNKKEKRFIRYIPLYFTGLLSFFIALLQVRSGWLTSWMKGEWLLLEILYISIWLLFKETAKYGKRAGPEKSQLYLARIAGLISVIWIPFYFFIPTF